MYPFLRMAWIVARTPRLPDMTPDDATVLPMMCQLWDADMFGEMNNGRHLTLFDIGRFHYGKRIGFLDLLRRKKWGLVVGGSTIQYRKRLRPFQRFEMQTRCLGRDDRWFYFEQTTWRRGDACSSALVRAAVVSGSEGRRADPRSRRRHGLERLARRVAGLGDRLGRDGPIASLAAGAGSGGKLAPLERCPTRWIRLAARTLRKRKRLRRRPDTVGSENTVERCAPLDWFARPQPPQRSVTRTTQAR